MYSWKEFVFLTFYLRNVFPLRKKKVLEFFVVICLQAHSVKKIKIKSPENGMVV